ncbi:UPF0339 protein [Nymphon striatum]|nr:UPF0339 protein [Nymphon striatum]
MKITSAILILLTTFIISCEVDKKEKTNANQTSTVTFTSNEYSDLVTLFKEWRTFEKPPVLEGAPDYTVESFEKRWPRFKELQSSIVAIDTTNWPVENKVDWMIVWAEMNGYDFNSSHFKTLGSDIQNQSIVLNELKEQTNVKDDAALVAVIDKAITSTNDLVSWLHNESTSKTGASGIGKDNYTWYLQNVHLVPLTWDDEVMILKRELARAWTSLKFEEHRNRNLPELVDANSPEAYDKMADASAKSLINFLDQQDIVTVKPYFDSALRAHLGEYVPKEKRNFFLIGEHFDPRPLYSHFYHWFELARMDTEPHEKMFMQAGLYDDSPRTKEIVYIMIAQRAARGLGSLYAHANEMTMEEAGGIHSEYTPRGWMKTEKELLIFEQHLYLRQPGYGTSYITEINMGKFEINKDKAGKFRFNLKAGNHQVILSSQGYATKASCENGIESVRKNSKDDSMFDRKKAKDGSPYFSLKSSNGQVIGSSEMYSGTSAMSKGIASIKKNAPKATVQDNT